jgi:uncharacterized protein (DUF1778 family)
MRSKQAETARTRPVNLRVRDEVRSIIDRAAQIRGKNRSEFMIEASLAAAEETVLDQTLVRVDSKSYQHFLKVLDQPPSSEGFARLMNVPKPWEP